MWVSSPIAKLAHGADRTDYRHTTVPFNVPRSFVLSFHLLSLCATHPAIIHLIFFSIFSVCHTSCDHSSYLFLFSLRAQHFVPVWEECDVRRGGRQYGRPAPLLEHQKQALATARNAVSVLAALPKHQKLATLTFRLSFALPKANFVVACALQRTGLIVSTCHARKTKGKEKKERKKSRKRARKKGKKKGIFMIVCAPWCVRCVR